MYRFICMRGHDDRCVTVRHRVTALITANFCQWCLRISNIWSLPLRAWTSFIVLKKKLKYKTVFILQNWFSTSNTRCWQYVVVRYLQNCLFWSIRHLVYFATFNIKGARNTLHKIFRTIFLNVSHNFFPYTKYRITKTFIKETSICSVYSYKHSFAPYINKNKQV